ncbi:MAG: Ltp family lipoprotein, partial [Ruminiclostridium sp.]|nr:Ltp family lipoprotein [Ruminiclostridium sp.]
YSISIDVSCEENLMFSRYDVCVYADNTKLGVVEHGTHNIFSASLTKGTHTIKFTEEGNESVDGSVNIVVDGNNSFKFEIACKNDQVEVESNASTSPDTSKIETDKPNTDNNGNDGGNILDDIFGDSQTTGQKNALRTAKNYLSVMSFSKKGLIEQLEYEGYSTEDATYAAENCGANWKEQSLKHAKSYLNTMAFSYSGLIDQLDYEGYSAEEATYGADNCGADWNEQAAKKAKSYLDVMAFSRDGLIDQLMYEGFTYDQAVYGVTAVGY